uniref:Secreted protein n=1 Tax=Phragmatopoma lapidosa TaxID=341668 RepID=A0A0A0R228_9ANNE|nr:hypothetical protein [Phragmatopoma lapidosa]
MIAAIIVFIATVATSYGCECDCGEAAIINNNETSPIPLELLYFKPQALGIDGWLLTTDVNLNVFDGNSVQLNATICSIFQICFDVTNGENLKKIKFVYYYGDPEEKDKVEIETFAGGPDPEHICMPEIPADRLPIWRLRIKWNMLGGDPLLTVGVANLVYAVCLEDAGTTTPPAYPPVPTTTTDSC